MNFYLVTTGEWTFTPEDRVFAKSASAWFSTITDGPYSTYILAEHAANLRIRRIDARFVTVCSNFEPHGIGGVQGPHGNVSLWQRDLLWHGHEDKQGWQTVELVALDRMP